MSKILLLGASGYIGQAFTTELARRSCEAIPLSRAQVNYCDFSTLRSYIRDELGGIDFLINAAGYTGQSSIDQCEIEKDATLRGNLLLPQMLSHLAAAENFPWLQVGTGCLYQGDNGGSGYTEEDPPNFCFSSPPCNFYCGVKALAEQVLRGDPRCYIARLRIPFDEINEPRNFLAKLLTYEKVYVNLNTISHRGEFVSTCLDLFERDAPRGIYNITNPGAMNTREIVSMMEKILQPDREFIYWESDEEFYKFAKSPRANCVLNMGKLESEGIKLRPLEVAIRESLEAWESDK
jgi:dTDP-4-dehydrorhamnose reductase